MADSKKIPLIAIVGPTASGKTKLAVDVAKHFDGEVVSADSMQIYKYMNIGTAKPTEEEMQGIEHHLIDFLEPNENFSVAQYIKLANKKIRDIHSRGKLPIIAGGTGLYISSLLDNVNFSDIGKDESIREELFAYAKEHGNEALGEMLREIDPEIMHTLHFNNLPRVVRAIELYRLTGKNMSWHIAHSKMKEPDYDLLMIGLEYRDRQKLYDRINLRVDLMVEDGLLKEAEWLFNSLYRGTALQAIGYKELRGYFFDDEELEKCTDNIKMFSRRYAKRQLTWFRRDERINRIYIDDYENYDGVWERALSLINTHKKERAI